MKNRKPRKRNCKQCESEFYTSYQDQELCDECEALMIEEADDAEYDFLCGNPSNHNNGKKENCLECKEIELNL